MKKTVFENMWQDSNQPAQLQKLAIVLKFQI